MGQYYIDLSSMLSIEDMTQALRDEENFNSVFLDSRVMTADDLSVVNHAKFEERDSRPTRPITLVKHGDAAPAGSSMVWSGTMLIGGAIIAVKAYR
jgi:hypothetical protein